MTDDTKLESEIDALLAQDDTASIIDTLLSMPHVAAVNNDAWENILNARLQTRLVRRMRQMLEGEGPDLGGKEEDRRGRAEEEEADSRSAA